MVQKLSPAARRAKAARDKAYAMTPERRKKEGRKPKRRRAAGSEANNKGLGPQRISVGRHLTLIDGNDGEGTKKESGANYA